jgi:N-acetyl-anhydromuramyl-L-alanine amidase AmpD
MLRFLAPSLILGTVVVTGLVGCASADGNADGERGMDSALTGSAEGDDLASIAAEATETGDVAGVPFVPATEGGRQTGRPGKVQFVVIHDIEGSGRAGVETFRAPDAKVSAHYVIDKSGVAVQMVRESDTAFHTGSHYFNGAAIGIEHAGFVAEDGYTTQEYAASAKLVADIVTRYGIPVDREHIICHSQVPSTEDETQACAPEATNCGGRNHHDDPGVHWDWDSYLTKVKAEVAALPSGKQAPATSGSDVDPSSDATGDPAATSPGSRPLHTPGTDAAPSGSDPATTSTFRRPLHTPHQ